MLTHKHKMESTNHRGYKLVFSVLILSCFVVGFLIGHLGIPKSNDVNQITTSCEETPSVASIKSLLDLLSRSNIENNVRYFSSQPHMPGSRRQKELAYEVKKNWTEYGFDVEMPEYDVLLTVADEKNPDYIEITRNDGTVLYKYTFSMQAKADPNSNKTWSIPRYFISTPSGSVRGGLLYVYEGRKQDFDVLRKLNISCNGSIVIVKKTAWRKQQVENAINCEALAVLFFDPPNPTDMLHRRKGNVYPNSTWLPKHVPLTFPLTTLVGDPLTPELPSINGVYRLDKNEDMPTILVQLIEYSVAQELLSRLEGETIPKEWKVISDNKLYRIGPSISQNAKLRLTVNTNTTVRKVYNVIGTVHGWDEPDHWVLVGNHRDAISFGAMDAVSGSAALMEMSRGLGELLKRGWKPRRTVKLCSWAAEESMLIGSTEWVEENVAILRERAVAYINIDWLVHGNYTLKSNGNPMLKDLIFSQTKLVSDPYISRETIYSTWSKRRPSIISKCFPEFLTSGRGTDYEPFYEFAGVPSLDLQFVAKKNWRSTEYHTPYDTYHMSKMVDPKFNVHFAQLQLTTRVLFSLIESTLIPFNLTYLPTSMERILNRTEIYYGELLKSKGITLDYIREGTSRLKEAVKTFQNLKWRSLNNKKLQQSRLNRRMMILNKMFLSAGSFQKKPSVRNVLYGISINKFYPNTTLPAISDAIELAKATGSWPEVKRQISVTQLCIEQAINTLKIHM